MEQQKPSAQDIVNRAQRDNKRTFPYIWRGKLNMVCYRERNRESTPIEANTEEFLTHDRIVRGQSLDRIEFQPNVAFKVTLDFKEAKETLPGSTRETTDWMLLSCNGDRAFYDRNMKKLVLQHCTPSVSVTADMVYPLTIIMSFDEDEWIAERVFGQ